MKVAFSNIGWSVHDDPAALAALRDAGVSGIEVAPTKVWPGWEGATASAARGYAARLRDAGFAVPALQAVLFGKPALSLFAADPSLQRAFTEHFRLVADLAGELGAHAIVYGAPKSRLRGDRPLDDAMAVAAERLAEVAELCAAQATCLCIEPNPLEYGCDFVTDAEQALDLLERVPSLGFGVHFDAAGLHMAGDDVRAAVRRAGSRLTHFHISEPWLAGFAEPVVDHASQLSVLADAGYGGWVSVEVDEKKHDLATTLCYLERVTEGSLP